ncbi:MAG: N-acetyltransferase [Paludibacteraceae bacterium]|nr:N-acetyltransferase [Paludibacteraceae bacterium]
MITFRLATVSDITDLLQLYSAARLRMASAGNPHQWTERYPQRELLDEDIEAGRSYVMLDDDKTIMAAFVLLIGPDPNYRQIDGAWLNDEPYATIHRLASRPDCHGIFHECVRFCRTICANLRVDTHRDNLIMQHLATKEGFHYCGIIRLIYKTADAERLAYQMAFP